MLVALLSLPLTALAIDTVYINSQSDWKAFCKKYDEKKVNVYLNCDVTINTKGYQMNKFIGTLDGQGHAFIIDYKDDKSESQNKPYYDKNWTKDSAPFEYASGTIKNLRITGTVAIRHGSFAYRQNNPLTEKIDNYYNSGLTIENCHCDVAFVVTDTKKTAGRTNAFVGGFVGKVDVGCEVTFDNCSFTGSFTYTNPNPDKGFVQEKVSGFVGTCKWGGFAISGKVTLNNCFSYITYDDRVAIRDFSYFVGGVKGETSVTNSYGYCVNKKGEPKTLTNDEGCTDLTTASGGAQMISSGELTWKLNGSRGTGKTWVQTIGSDSVPRLCTYFPTSLEVFNKESTRLHTKQDGWSSICSPFDVSLPAGVTAYVVTGINETDHTVTVNPYSGSIASVPLLLHTEGALQTIIVPEGYYNKYNAVGYLRGAYDDLAASDQYRVLDFTEGHFVKPTIDIPAYSCYLTGATADSYTLDKSEGDYGTIVLITSKDDWNDFCTNYSGKKVTAYLATDLTIDQTGTMNFVGTFYGQGHTVTLTEETASMFSRADGTISELNLRGTRIGRIDNPGLTYYSGDYTIRDCSFVYAGEFIKGETYTPKRYNVISTSKADNSYYVYDSTNKYKNYTQEQAQNGALTYILNGDRTGDAAVWVQTIGTDSLPTLKSTSPESKEVFYAAASTRKATTDHWATLFYPADLDLSSNADLRIYDDFGQAGDTLYCYENLSGQLYAGMPALLYSPSGLPAITLPEVYYNKVEPTTDFVGVYADTDASELYTLTIQNDSAYFKTLAETLPAWQCYTTTAAKAFDDGTVITSKDDWNKFKTRYSGRSTNARLVCDLELTASDEPMQSFAGAFNGTMATITLNGAQAPFKNAKGLIKQLTVKGTPASGSAAIVGTASGDLTLQDCYSSAGALLGYATSDAKARKAAATNAIVYNNCLTIVDTDTLAYVGNNATATKVTGAQVKSGELAYKLNAGRTNEDALWLQTIGTDAEPSLTSFTAGEVFEAAGGDYKLGTAGWGTLYYPTDVTLADGVKAYTVSSVEEKTTDGTTENYVVLKAVSGSTLPAYTAAILCSLAEGESTATEKTIPLATFYYNEPKQQFEDEDVTAMLYGVLESTEAPDGSYVMQNQSGRVAFYLVDTSVAQPTIPAFRCALLWLPTEQQSDAKRVDLRIDDETTAISNAALEPLLTDGPVYDLMGRRAHSLQKGVIYIKNGQKFVVR